jgi:hypothetical protein
MKISQNTISLLQSFSSINSNLHVKPGNKLVTRSATGSTQARATVDETFPVQFAIYDLNQLLSLLAVSGDADVEFGEKSMVIKAANGGVFEYYYADPSVVVAAPDADFKMDPLFSFTLPTSEVSVVQKSAAIVSATTLSIIAEHGKVTLKINDPKNNTSNTYKKALGDCNETFTMRMSIDNFRPIVPDTYDVQVGIATSRTGNRIPVFHFSSTSRKLTYLIAANPDSKVNV